MYGITLCRRLPTAHRAVGVLWIDLQGERTAPYALRSKDRRARAKESVEDDVARGGHVQQAKVEPLLQPGRFNQPAFGGYGPLAGTALKN
jgi:hypothetical protein